MLREVRWTDSASQNGTVTFSMPCVISAMDLNGLQWYDNKLIGSAEKATLLFGLVRERMLTSTCALIDLFSFACHVGRLHETRLLPTIVRSTKSNVRNYIQMAFSDLLFCAVGGIKQFFEWRQYLPGLSREYTRFWYC